MENEYVESVGGADVSFPMLGIEQMEKVEDAIRSRFRDTRDANIKQSGLTGEKMFAALRDMDVTTVGSNDIKLFIYNMPGTRLVLELSLKMGGKAETDIKAIIAKLNCANAKNLAGALIGFYKRNPVGAEIMDTKMTPELATALGANPSPL